MIRAAVSALLLCLLAPSATSESRNAWTTPHVLTIADGSDVDSLNPHLGRTAAAANLSEMTMAWLLKWDEHNQLYPELATEVPTKANGGISRDGRTITYHLRKGVKWSDGAPFDGDDVVFSVSAVNNPANHEAARFDEIASIGEPDKFTVIFHLKKPYAPASATYFSSCCANPSILPKHLLARYANINSAPYNSLPIGIGPFAFERWDRSKQVILVANQTYWRGRPKLDRIVYKVEPDLKTLLSDVAAHKVDMWYQFSGAYLAQLQVLPGIAVYRQPSYAYNHYDFNLTHAAVADPVVRRALRLATDRRAFVDNVEHGVGIVQDSALPVSAPYFSDMGTTPFDLARANAMLDAGGWTRGPDGIREKHHVRLSLTAAVIAGRPDIDAQLALMRRDWGKVGVRLSVVHVPTVKMFAPAAQGGVVFGNAWDVVTFAWAADPLGEFSGIYGCDSFPPAGQNDTRWCNRKAQGAMTALLGHYDLRERKADLKIEMHEFVSDVPSIVSYLRIDLFAYNKDLKHYKPNNLTPFDNMMDVDI